jgi:hypothetical protein
MLFAEDRVHFMVAMILAKDEKSRREVPKNLLPITAR